MLVRVATLSGDGSRPLAVLPILVGEHPLHADSSFCEEWLPLLWSALSPLLSLVCEPLVHLVHIRGVSCDKNINFFAQTCVLVTCKERRCVEQNTRLHTETGDSTWFQNKPSNKEGNDKQVMMQSHPSGHVTQPSVMLRSLLVSYFVTIANSKVPFTIWRQMQ